MRKSVVAAVIVATAALAACHVNQEDAGATISKTYQVGNFQQIEVAGSYDVDVRTGSNASVSAQGSEKLLERTVVEVEGDKLVIRPESNHGFFNFGWSHHGHAHFTVTVPQLSAASMAGSGGMKIDKIQGQSFEGTIAGSGGIDVTSIEVQSLKFSVAGSGDVKAGTGKAQSAEYEIAGSGSVDASAVDSPEIKIDVAGSGGVRAHGSGSAQVSIMGSGDVNITGGAKCQVSKMGSGDVHCS